MVGHVLYFYSSTFWPQAECPIFAISLYFNNCVLHSIWKEGIRVVWCKESSLRCLELFLCSISFCVLLIISCLDKLEKRIYITIPVSSMIETEIIENATIIVDWIPPGFNLSSNLSIAGVFMVNKISGFFEIGLAINLSLIFTVQFAVPPLISEP